jgi:DNA polymerase-3 subunit epsilon
MRLRSVRDEAASRYLATARPPATTPWRDASWLAIDLELTGLDPREDHVIAVGMVPIESGRVRLGGARYSLVASTRRSTPGAVVTHKLRVADLAGAPGVEEVLDTILEELGGRVPVFHVAAVERAFLGPLLRRRRLRMPACADTEALGRLWLRGRGIQTSGGLSLERLSARLGQRAAAPHHALADALATAQAFIALASHLDRETSQTVGTLTAAEATVRGPRRMA